MWAAIEKYFRNTTSPVQLVQHYDEVSESVKMKNCVWPAIAQKKEDGVYCMVIKYAGSIRYYSRTGNQFYTELYIHWDESFFKNLPEGCWIAELINPTISLEILSGLLNTNRKKPWSQAEFANMWHYSTFVFRDYITVDELLQGCSSVNYEHRLIHRVKKHIKDQTQVVHSKFVYNYEDWLVFQNEMINAGFEGAVLHQAYESWRAGHKGYKSMKAVRGIHADLKCIGVVIGKGKFAGLISALTFEWKGKRFNAGLGKGWDIDTMKVHTAAWQEDEFNVINQIWHVSALQESSKGVLRLPKVNEMRIDKKEPDVH